MLQNDSIYLVCSGQSGGFSEYIQSWRKLPGKAMSLLVTWRMIGSVGLVAAICDSRYHGEAMYVFLILGHVERHNNSIFEGTVDATHYFESFS